MFVNLSVRSLYCKNCDHKSGPEETETHLNGARGRAYRARAGFAKNRRTQYDAGDGGNTHHRAVADLAWRSRDGSTAVVFGWAGRDQLSSAVDHR